MIMTFGKTSAYSGKTSQQELGKLSCISGEIIAKYERDETKHSIETTKKLTDA